MRLRMRYRLFLGLICCIAGSVYGEEGKTVECETATPVQAHQEDAGAFCWTCQKLKQNAFIPHCYRSVMMKSEKKGWYKEIESINRVSEAWLVIEGATSGSLSTQAEFKRLCGAFHDEDFWKSMRALVEEEQQLKEQLLENAMRQVDLLWREMHKKGMSEEELVSLYEALQAAPSLEAAQEILKQRVFNQ